MEHCKGNVRQAAGCGSAGDNTARFLRELRQLRHGAGLGPAELAARAHYPHDSIMAAEVGPALPDLPVLAAYVRGCGGTTEEWEERWRSLTSAPSQAVLPTRSAGGSPAASAGARIGSTSPVPEGPDPATVLKALDRVAEQMAGSADNARAETATVAPASLAAPGQAPATVAHVPAARKSAEPTEADVPAGNGMATPPPPPGATAYPAKPRGRTGAPSPVPSRVVIVTLVAALTCALVALLAIFA